MLNRQQLGLVLVLLTAALSRADDSSKTDHAALQGTWTAVAGEIGGKAVTDDALKVFKIVVKDDTMTFAGNASTFVLDVTKKPKVLAVTPVAGPRKGKTQRAIYSLERDALKLCLRSEPAEENAPPPQEFATKANDGLVLVTFKRDVDPKPDNRSAGR